MEKSVYFGSRAYCIIFLTAAFAGICGLLRSAAQATDNSPQIWVDQSFEDFAAGTFGAGGANLFVSRNGTLQSINRWDINQDGYIDLFFANTHDINYVEPIWIYYQGQNQPTPVTSLGGYRIAAADLNGDGYPDLIVGNRDNNISQKLPSYIYWGSAAGFTTRHRVELWTEGVSGIAIADLNGDGRPDVVFANEASDVSFVYWNGPTGFSSGDRTDLPTDRATGVVATDLNGDGLADVVFANGGDRDGSYIYWGNRGARPFSTVRRTVLETQKAVGVAAADLNRDGRPELVFANNRSGRSGQAEAFIYWADSDGYASSRRSTLPLNGATGVTTGDLNGDGYPELIFPCSQNFQSIYAVRVYRGLDTITGSAPSLIYFGSESGYSAGRRTEVPTLAATAAAVGDYNGDGRPDVAFSQLRSKERYETESLLFLGGTSGLDLRNPLRFTTRGATDVLMTDLNRDGKTDLAFANKLSGNAQGTVPSYVYWGGERGYSSERRTELPSSGAYGGSIADLNDDGWPDLLICNSDHDDRMANTGSRIFWGGPDGLRPNRFTKVDVDSAMASAVADLNRDGYLDIVFSSWELKKDGLFVYWGGPSGYSRERRTSLPQRDGRALALSDLNLDGFLDIIATSVAESDAKIFWGSPAGFSAQRVQSLPGLSPVSAEVADLNADGYPDVILCNFWEPKTQDHRVPSYIYWGSAQGFSATRRMELPTLGAHDAAVVDLDKDGFLDIVFSNYHSNDSRVVPAYVYWGSRQGFDPHHRSLLPAQGAAGLLVADLNRDGNWDVVFANHSNEHDHHTNAQILWGSDGGLQAAKITLLPTLGPHNMVTVDIGNRLTRELSEEYVSSARSTSMDVSRIRLSWVADTPNRTTVKFQIRSAPTQEGLRSASWVGPAGAGSFFHTSGETSDLRRKGHRWVQYRAILETPDGGSSPLLRRVKLELRR